MNTSNLKGLSFINSRKKTQLNVDLPAFGTIQQFQEHANVLALLPVAVAIDPETPSNVLLIEHDVRKQDAIGSLVIRKFFHRVGKRLVVQPTKESQRLITGDNLIKR